MIIAPFKRSMKKMRELLNQHYHNLDISGNMDSKSDVCIININNIFQFLLMDINLLILFLHYDSYLN